ncbi:MAG: methyltransferase domain-containing protein [Rubrivivax sp.]|nr:methyltransferase domain-containing protein [Rubrivivax sp.]
MSAAQAGHDPAADAAAAWSALLDAASAPYRGAGRFAYHFARGKLSHDPVFRSLLERGLLGAGTRTVVDIGCGQGLMASLLQACGAAFARGLWPAAWPALPQLHAYHGIELMARDVARAQAAQTARAAQSSPAAPAASGAPGPGLPMPQFTCADMRAAALPPCDLVIILDVLHYVDHEAQQALLARVRDALRAGTGASPRRLLLRVGDAASRRGFAASQWVDRIVTGLRGHRVPPTWGRTVAQWTHLLASLGFEVEPLPMSEGTPFANVLLVADLASAASGGPAVESGR